MSAGIGGRSLRAGLALSAVAGLLSCSGSATPKTATVRWPAGVATNADAALVVELRSAEYRERELSLVVLLHNASDQPIAIEPEAILLQTGTLEFPMLPDPQATPVPAELDAGQGHELSLLFAIGPTQDESMKLRLRGVRQGSRWLQVAALVVPGRPLANESRP